MKRTTVGKVLVIVVLLAVALTVALRYRQPGAVEVGDSAPDFSLPGLSPERVSLHDYRPRVVVLNFWATWCPPCVEETPGLERFSEELREQGVTVVGVSVDEDAAALRDFVTRAHISFPIARDPDRSMAARYGTFKFPETYILDRDGKVAEKVIGATNWDDPRMKAFVKDLARGLPPVTR